MFESVVDLIINSKPEKLKKKLSSKFPKNYDDDGRDKS